MSARKSDRMQPLEMESHISSTRVYVRLLDAVTQGVYLPGDRLSINDIAEQLSVSITPVREALERLQSNGLVERKPYRGFFVKQFSDQEIRDVYHTRSALESYAVRLAIQNAPAEALEELVDIQRKGYDMLARDDVNGYAAYNGEFHDCILRLSGNTVLYKTAAAIRLQVSVLASKTIKIPGRPIRAIKEHDRILEEMRGRNEPVAAREMESHIINAMEEMFTYDQN